jgi:hypothetical protein
MRLKTSVTAAAAAGLLALGLTASASGPAHAAAALPASLGPGWAPIELHAYSGNGCAKPKSDTYLAPIISWPCGQGWVWYYRFLGANDDELELVDPSGSYALGISGGAWKLETPNASTTWVLDTSGLTGYFTLEDSTRTYGMTPQAKGDDVGLINFNNDGTETDLWDLIS